MIARFGLCPGAPRGIGCVVEAGSPVASAGDTARSYPLIHAAQHFLQWLSNAYDSSPQTTAVAVAEKIRASS